MTTMVQCSAPGCNNSSTKGFLLKRFPRDPERRAKWATNIEKINWEPTNNSYVCEVHFDDNQWESKRLDRLKWNAVPTMFHKRPKYVKRKERLLPKLLLPIQPDLPCSVNQDQSRDQLVYIIKMDDCIAGMNTSIDTNGDDKAVFIPNCGDDVVHDKMFKFSSEIRDDSKKDEIIAELRKEIAEKDVCLLKYEKMICQMNSHLEKLKGRLKFWRDFRERDKFSLRKVRKIHKPFAV